MAERFNLSEKEFIYSVDGFFSYGVEAGFSGPGLNGDAREESALLSSDSVDISQTVYMDQIHGSCVEIVKDGGCYRCDGIFTTVPGLTQIVRTADCLPLLFYNERDNIAGAVHMGWRSASAGILDNIPYDMSDFKVLCGPGLRRCCYNVGAEFHAHSRLSGYLHNSPDKLIFDPVAFAKDTLMARGLTEDNFLDIGICNYCSEMKLHSHRRDRTKNRILNFIRMRSV